MALFAAAGLFVGGVAMPSAKAADLGGDCCADLEERVAELEATTARKGNRRVSLTISGQVSTMVQYWRDGNKTDSSDFYVVDNVMAGGTFFQFAGSARINPHLSAGFQIVVALETGSRSHQVNQLDDDATPSTDNQITMTRSNWYIESKDVGRRKRPLATAAWPPCWGAADRVKHTVLKHVAKDGKAHGGRDHLDGRAAASLACGG